MRREMRRKMRRKSMKRMSLSNARVDRAPASPWDRRHEARGLLHGGQALAQMTEGEARR